MAGGYNLGYSGYHPILASPAETGDLLDVRWQEGSAHTADGALEFILELVDRLEGRYAESVSVRMDASVPPARRPRHLRFHFAASATWR